MSMYSTYKGVGPGPKLSFNPNLAAKDQGFQSWFQQNTIEGKSKIPYSDSLDYDYYSYYRNGDYKSYTGGHFPDTYKRPNHPTFSNESIYSVPATPGGSWKGDKFVPSSTMKMKKLYAGGGEMELIGAIQNMGLETVNAIAPPNQYGHQGVAANAVKGSFQGFTGSALGIMKGLREQKDERLQKAKEAGLLRSYQLAQYSARAAQDPYLSTGTPGEGYYATGGSLKTDFIRYKAKGGSLSKLSSDTVEVKGPSHANGGVELSGTGAEVEGGETIKGDYVLSKKLGFAQAHKPIAKAIGELEKKALNPITLKSLGRLRDQEQALILMQEHVRNSNNLQ